MTKFFISLLLAFPLFASATEINNVWLPFSGSSLEAICRTVWNTYDTYFQTSSVLHLKQGASGELASRDMLTNTASNKSICAGATMILYNKYLFPDIKTHGEELEMIVKVVRMPTVWYGPNRTPDIKNLDEYVGYLRSLKRPINVGVFQGANRTVAQYLSTHYNLDTNIIMFKNGPQMYPSLVDGTLDLAFDGGGAVSIAKEGRFKVIGYNATIKIRSLNQYVNFTPTNKDLAGIDSWFGIAVAKDADPEFKEQLARRLEFVIKQDQFKLFVENNNSSADGTLGSTLANDINYQRSTIKKYWK